MIIIAGKLYVAPERRDEYLTKVADVAARARRAAGCLDFVQAPDALEPGRINIYEQWSSDADVEAFRNAGGPTPALPEVTRAEVKKYRIAAIESP